MTRPSLRLLPALLLPLLATTPFPAAAMGLGEATVRSALGSPLRVEIAIRTAPDEVPDEQCITLLPAPGLPVDSTQALGLQAHLVRGARNTLLVESLRPVTEPYATLRVRLDCGGTALVRDYALLIDPAPGAASAPMFTAVAAAQPLVGAPHTAMVAGAPVAATPAAQATAKEAPHGRHHHHPGAPRPLTADGRAALRLDLGAARTGSGAADPRGASFGGLRLDVGFAPPSAVTTDLVAERERLREMRTLLMTEDNPIDRLLVLQSQVSTLDAQLRSLQGKPAGTLATPPDAGTPAAAPAPAASTATTGPRLAAHGEDNDALTLVLWAAAAVGTGLLAAGTLLLLRRRRAGAPPEFDSPDQALAAALVAGQRPGNAGETAAPPDATPDSAPANPRRRPVEVPGSGRRPIAERRVPEADVPSKGVAPSGNTSEEARSAYLAARFPELAAGLIQLTDPDSVVAGARIYVDHGDPDRANELLEVAIQGPCESDVRPWLALFELHRQRGEASPYAVLLERFRAHFVASRYIPEILAAGRQLDPGRAEFQSPEGSPTIEIPSEGTSWLNAELDFVPQALAQELHDTLMAELADPQEDAPPAVKQADGGLS